MKLALVGAGHAHLAVLAQAARLRAAGLDPILVAPATFDYSGLASGVLSGALSPERARIDIAALARRTGVAHAVSEVVSVDRKARRLTLKDGAGVDYDVVSFNIGSTVADPQGWAGRDGVWPVKPLASLLALSEALEAAFVAGAAPPAVVVAGDGPTGFEIAAALAGLHERHGRRVNLTLVGPKADAGWAPVRAGRRLIDELGRRGIRRVAAELVSHDAGAVRLSDGRRLPCDHLVLATGLTAPPLTRALGTPLDAIGRIRVAPTLASVADDRLFAVGDCATMEGHPRPLAGVFGVRAAPVLVDNLCSLGTGKPARAYRPQSHWLSIIDLGNDTGLAIRGNAWWWGRAALAFKRQLDLGFVRRSRA